MTTAPSPNSEKPENILWMISIGFILLAIVLFGALILTGCTMSFQNISAQRDSVLNDDQTAKPSAQIPLSKEIL